MKPLATIAAVALATLCGGVAWAGVLTPKGEVLLNKGSGYLQITGPVAVGNGDMVVVNSGVAELVCETESRGSLKDNDAARILDKGRTYSVAVECGAEAAEQSPGNGVSAGALAVLSGLTKVGTGLLLIGRHPGRPGPPPRRPASP